MVIWFIGKSGSGKSFFSKKLFFFLKKKYKRKFFFLLDGDEFRKYISSDLGYSKLDRKSNSQRLINFCRYLDSKKIYCICSILSIFPNHQKTNRRTFSKYVQILINADYHLLKRRDNKKIYTKKNVVGKDIFFPQPYKSDLTIENNFKNYRSNFLKIQNLVLKNLNN
jgi:adenylylsulfate kinase-like enzyme